jgi:flagellum-specific peptidoglycan hydrolase FlgJ
MTGIAFAQGTVADITSPTSMPVHLLAFSKTTTPTSPSDNALRAAVVSAANYYLRLAQGKTPAQMEALIWQNASIGGADHGASCAAFASLALEAGAQATGQQSWVTGGTSYPWPLHSWADVRVDPNPQSPGITSILQDAQAHQRWHPLGDGYVPQPGDWVLFPGHVEVVTKYAGGVLYTIGGDSMPDMSVNAHQYDAPLSAQGVTGFVNNGDLLSTVSQSSRAPQSPPSHDIDPTGDHGEQGQADQGQPLIPGLMAPGFAASTDGSAGRLTPLQQAPASGAQATAAASATIPGALPITGNFTNGWSSPPTPRYTRNQVTPATAGAPTTTAQRAFISEVAAGAVAAQQKYGIPAAVTIAQAIDESGWGQSALAAQDNNLFGIKGSGPAGSVMLPTSEYENGQWVSVVAPFRVYSNVAESIDDHSLLLATGSSYKQAMADRQSPDAFANDLTGVYATDPNYGANLITIMRKYNLYRYDGGTSAARAGASRNAAGQSAPGGGASPQRTAPDGVTASGAASSSGAAQGAAVPGLGAIDAVVPNAGSRAATGKAAAAPGASGETAAAPSAAADGTVGQRTTGRGAVSRGAPRVSTASPSAAGPGTAASGYDGYPSAAPGGASIPGLLNASAGTPATASGAALPPARHATATDGSPAVKAGPRNAHVSTRRYVPEMPATVTTAFVTSAKTPLLRAKPFYQDVASSSGIRWQLLAACDWMQCRAEPRLSPVHGERLGARNSDGTIYRTKSQALAQCASDLIELASAVYRIDLTRQIYLSVRELANVFAAFRWGGLLRAHHISAMEFPYSVAGLTVQHMKMRWPDIAEPHAPDKPGSRFRDSFGAVPLVLGLDYPAVA